MSEKTWADYSEPSFVDVGGVRTAYRRSGSGEPLLFLHGGGLTRRWLPLYEQLSKHFDVIAPEHPGFGDSDAPEWLNDFTEMAIHYADLMAAFDLQKVHVAGHSLGAWIGAEFAGIYPDKLLSLSLVAPMGLRPDAAEALPDMFRMTPEQGLDAILGGDAERWLPYLDEGDPGAQAIQDYKELITAARLFWNPRYSLKLERRLSRIQVPAQVIAPQRDGIFPPSVARRYAELIPGARLVTLTGEVAPTEHLLIIQEPARLADQIIAVTQE